MTLLEIIPIGVAIVGLGLRFYLISLPVPEVQAPRMTAVLPARKRQGHAVGASQRPASRASRGHAAA